MAKPVMEISGLSSLRDALKNGPRALRKHVSPAVAATTVSGTGKAKNLVPRDTGRLQASIYADPPASTGLTGRVRIDDAAFYWRMVEYGTIYQNARPFLRTTAELETPEFHQRLEDAAQKFADEFGQDA